MCRGVTRRSIRPSVQGTDALRREPTVGKALRSGPISRRPPSKLPPSRSWIGEGGLPHDRPRPTTGLWPAIEKVTSLSAAISAWLCGPFSNGPFGSA